VMFGAFLAHAKCDPELTVAAERAFRVLVDALIELQHEGLVRGGRPEELAVFVWSSVHGLAMLAIDGQLGQPNASIDELATMTVERVWDAVALPTAPPSAASRRTAVRSRKAR
jgi:Tetracyclin repressor-like, C-terminal domain